MALLGLALVMSSLAIPAKPSEAVAAAEDAVGSTVDQGKQTAAGAQQKVGQVAGQAAQQLQKGLSSSFRFLREHATNAYTKAKPFMAQTNQALAKAAQHPIVSNSRQATGNFLQRAGSFVGGAPQPAAKTTEQAEQAEPAEQAAEESTEAEAEAKPEAEKE